MPQVSPAILSWARETARLSTGGAVKKLVIKDARGVMGVNPRNADSILGRS